MTKRLLGLLTALALVTPSPASGGGPERLRWQSLAPAPTPRTEAAAAAVGHDIYLVGGFVPGGATVPLVEIYDTRRDEWRTGPSLPIPVNHAYVAAIADTLYVFGGYLGPAYGGPLQPLSAPIDRAFALRDGTWEPIAPLPFPRGAGSAAVVGDKIYLVGGMDADSLADETLVYDSRNDTWSKVPPLAYPRQHLGVASDGDTVYAVGGRLDLLTSNTWDASAFDADARHWREVAPMRVPRGGLGAAFTVNDYVVAVGGEHQAGVFDAVEAFDTRRGKWVPLPSLPTARHGLGVVSVGTKVYALVGGTEAGYSYSTANEAIDLSALRYK